MPLPPAAVNFEPFITEYETWLAATWPEVTEILESDHADRIPWTDETLVLPYAAIVVNRWPRYTKGPAGSMLFRPQIDTYYVAETEGKSVALRGRLATLINAAWPVNPFTTAKVEDIGDPDYSELLKANQIFSSANRSQRAGVVPIICLTGWTRS